MTICAETEVTMEFDDVGDAVQEAIAEVLEMKGIRIRAMKIFVGSSKNSLPYTDIREFSLKVTGDYEP